MKWQAIARILASLTLSLGATSCAVSTNGKPQAMLIEVWKSASWPPAQMPAPEGFKVTPREAYRAVADSQKLSVKHKWSCYRDGSHYYIADTFGELAPTRTAALHGIKVNGVSGAIE